MRAILPKERVDIFPRLHLPFFYFAGPNFGGSDWQWRMSQYLASRLSDFTIATPSCRFQPGSDHPFLEKAVPGDGEPFPRQLPWERHYMTLAATYGCLVFWLPVESTDDPRHDGLPYAMDTRGELGEWRGRMAYGRETRIVVGAENGFPGLSVIERNFQAVTSNFVLHPTLEATADAAIALSRC